MRRFGPFFGAFLSIIACSVSALEAQDLDLEDQPLALEREYPGAGPYQCLAPVSPVLPSPDDRARAGQLATDANQAMILGDFERVQALLLQAVELDPSSADLAYRHARVLEDLVRIDDAMVEYCRSLDLGVESLGVLDARDRLNALWNVVRALIPEEARVAFAAGLSEADDSSFTDAIGSFTTAIDVASDWPAPLYNRGVVNEWAGDQRAALRDFRAYLLLVAPDETDAILVSQRIGLLEGAASVITPSPTGALALGIVPGMGHYYTSRPMAGTLTLATAGFALAAGYGFQNITTVCLDDVPAGGVCPIEDVVDETTERPYLLYGVGIAAAITLVGAVDAYLKARNRRDAFAAIRAPEVVEPTLEAGLPTISTHGSQIDFNFVRLRFR